MAYDTIPTGATLKPTKFEASIPQQDIDDLKQLLKLSKLGPKTYENTTTSLEGKYYGVSYEWMSDAKKHWETDYDWRKTEKLINSFPNFTVDVKDDSGTSYNIHFAALFSEKKDAIPIALFHGWPGSFLEFLDILSLLKSRYSPADLPYHIIVPSLPGYGYSADITPKDKDWTTEDTSRLMNKMMVGLGFGDGYVAQGGDIGSYVSRILGAYYKECKAVHLNFCIMSKAPSSVSESDVNKAEQKGLERYQEFGSTGNAYAREHGTRPSTIGFVLSSSPIALLAWIAEKFHTWTDPTSTPSTSSILDSVTLYWLTQSFPRSIYPYREQFRLVHDFPDHHIPDSKAFGYSWFPYELAPMPKAWVEATGKLVWHRQHDKGGHFAAMEKPEELWGDVEDFVKEVWKGGKEEGGRGKL